MKASTLKYLDRGHMLFVLLLLAQFQFWDGLTTQVFVGSGLIKEANPLMAPLISEGSFLIVKLMGIVAVALLLWLIHMRFPRIALSAASCISALYIFVVTWNFTVFFCSA